jgi:hypothetical protein
MSNMFGFYFKYYWATGISTGLSVRKSIQISHLLHGTPWRSGKYATHRKLKVNKFKN